MTNPTRLTRDQSRQQTRERLIASARRLVAARGFAAASVRDIAEGAGYSQGAFYSNFDSKEALLLEVLRVFKTGEARQVAVIIDAAGNDLGRALAGVEAWAEALSRNPEQAMLAAELQLQALRDPLFGAAYATVMAEQRGRYADLARQLFALAGMAPSVHVEDIVSGLMSLERGVALDRAAGFGTGFAAFSAFLRGLFSHT